MCKIWFELVSPSACIHPSVVFTGWSSLVLSCWGICYFRVGLPPQFSVFPRFLLMEVFSFSCFGCYFLRRASTAVSCVLSFLLNGVLCFFWGFFPLIGWYCFKVRLPAQFSVFCRFYLINFFGFFPVLCFSVLWWGFPRSFLWFIVFTRWSSLFFSVLGFVIFMVELPSQSSIFSFSLDGVLWFYPVLGFVVFRVGFLP